MSPFAVRIATPADAEAIRAVHIDAFAGDAEANLVARLHASGRATISFVATTMDGQIVGHILFSPATIGDVDGFALAPLAVSRAHQNVGIGTALVRAGLGTCRAFGANFVIVLGHPSYYPRFGFRKASEIGIGNEYGADDAFMIVVMNEGAMPRADVAKYAPEFADLP